MMTSIEFQQRIWGTLTLVPLPTALRLSKIRQLCTHRSICQHPKMKVAGNNISRYKPSGISPGLALCCDGLCVFQAVNHRSEPWRYVSLATHIGARTMPSVSSHPAESSWPAGGLMTPGAGQPRMGTKLTGPAVAAPPWYRQNYTMLHAPCAGLHDPAWHGYSMGRISPGHLLYFGICLTYCVILGPADAIAAPNKKYQGDLLEPGLFYIGILVDFPAMGRSPSDTLSTSDIRLPHVAIASAVWNSCTRGISINIRHSLVAFHHLHLQHIVYNASKRHIVFVIHHHDNFIAVASIISMVNY